MVKKAEQASEVRADEHDPVGAFVAHLEQIADLRRKMNGAQQWWAWTSHEELILTMVGEPTVVDALTLPDGVPVGQPRDCYRNAYLLSASNPRYTYVEGFAMGPAFPVNHAWVVDDATGGVVDPTWARFDAYEGHTTYMGLRFSDEFIARIVHDSGGYPSVFENDFTRKGQAQRHGFKVDETGMVVDFDVRASD